MTFVEKLKYTFKSERLLERALTHKSFHHENLKTSPGDNEKLEFLGDSVIDLIVSDLLMSHYPELNEGELSKARASLVNESVLAEMSSQIGLDGQVRLGHGESKMRGDLRPRLRASTFEAIVGAIYLDSDFATVHAWLEDLYRLRIEKLDLQSFFISDYKTALQEQSQSLYKKVPTYELISQSGPDHAKEFKTKVSLMGLVEAFGIGRSKKHSEQEAARAALEKLNEK